MFSKSIKLAAVLFVSAVVLQVPSAFADDAANKAAVSADKPVAAESKKSRRGHKARLAMVGGESKSSKEEAKTDGFIPSAPLDEFISGGG